MSLFKEYIEKYLKIILSPIFFIFGYIFYCFTKKTNNLVYQSYVKTYCISSGYINEIITFFIRLFSRSKKKKLNLNHKIDNVNEELISKGYVVLKNKLEVKLLDDLIDITKTLKCSNNLSGENSVKEIFDKDSHFLPTYSYSEKELLENSAVKNTINYLQQLNISENYFNSKPHLIAVNMWWSNKKDKVESNSAQNFHFDLDGIKWLKYFVYLTDVTATSGPHVYVEGTHKPFSKPYNILKRGYARVSDKEIQNCYSSEKIKMITGKKGTIIVGDTSCFHKGLVPKEDIRLIFEATFSNSFFGPDLVNKKIINQLNF